MRNELCALNFRYTTLEAPDEGLEKLKKINYTKIRCGMAFNRGGDGDWTMGARFDGEFNLLTDDGVFVCDVIVTH